MSNRLSHRQAVEYLATKDKTFARLVKQAGPLTLRRPSDSHFESLARAIVFQQLAGSAARAIYGRVNEALKGDISAASILKCRDEKLRAAGLSLNKLTSLKDLAQHVKDGDVVLDPRKIGRLSDQEIIDHLVGVRGIGRWTVDMFLLFQLRRLDVWPTGDLGVRNGFGLTWKIDSPTPKILEELGEKYRPYRSVIALYCWKAVDLSRKATKKPVLLPKK